MNYNHLENSNELESYLTLYSVSEAASILSCGKNEIYRLLNTGQLHGYRNKDAKTSTWRIPQKAIVEYIRKVSGI